MLACFSCCLLIDQCSIIYLQDKIRKQTRNSFYLFIKINQETHNLMANSDYG